MKRMMIAVFCLISAKAFAVQTFEEFSIDVMNAFKNVDYVSYEVYVKYNGNADSLIEDLQKNGVCYNEEDEALKLLKGDQQ